MPSIPRVSLIIATYNRGPRIATTLDSVLGQSRPADELIVVDDCSPDQTGEWVERHYPAFRVVRPAQNGGTSAARNYGAQHATGERLVFLDHDDLLLPHAVKTLGELLDAFPTAQAAYTDHEYHNSVDQICYPNHHEAQPAFHRLRTVPTLETRSQGRLYGRDLYHALLSGNLLQQPWMIRREAFTRLGGFNPAIRYCEDWELYLRITDRFPVVLSDQVTSQHIIEGENLSLNPKQDVMHMAVLRQAIARERFRSPMRALKLRRRLAGYYKTRADRAAGSAPWESWRANLAAFWYWPLDHVVAARALFLGPCQLVASAARPAGPRTDRSS